MEIRSGEIRYYVIKILEEETMTEMRLNTSDNSTFVTEDTFHPFYHYIISVAVVSMGMGPFSPQRSVRMPATGGFQADYKVKGII